MASNSMATTISKVVSKTIEKYNSLMESEHVGKKMIIDGQNTLGQIQDNYRQTTTKEFNTKTCTCLLNTKVIRGSYIEILPNDEDGQLLKGIVNSLPNKTPVDWYFSVLLFNTTVERHRNQLEYDENGDVINNNPLIIDKIPSFVQRVGMRERQVDVGIDRDSVNEIITTKNWDLQKNDILYVGSDRYKITDVEELDEEIFHAYMTYYRE